MVASESENCWYAGQSLMDLYSDEKHIFHASNCAMEQSFTEDAAAFVWVKEMGDAAVADRLCVHSTKCLKCTGSPCGKQR